MAARWPRLGVSTAARPMGGYIDKSYDSSGSDNRRGFDTVVIPSPRGEGLHGLEVDDKVEFGGLLDRKTRRARTRTSLRMMSEY
jgi:hypothetical protein